MLEDSITFGYIINQLLSNMQCINCERSEATKGHLFCRDCYSLKKEKPIYCLKCKIKPRNGSYDWCKGCFSLYQQKTSSSSSHQIVYQNQYQNQYYQYQNQYKQSSTYKKCSSCNKNIANPGYSLCQTCYEHKKCRECKKRTATKEGEWCQECYVHVISSANRPPIPYQQPPNTCVNCGEIISENDRACSKSLCQSYANWLDKI